MQCKIYNVLLFTKTYVISLCIELKLCIIYALNCLATYLINMDTYISVI